MNIWFKLFYRNSKKNWLNTLINISGLTLGLVSLILVSLYYNDEKLYDQWNAEKDTIYKVSHLMLGDDQIFDESTRPEGAKSKEIIPEITEYFSMKSWTESWLLKYNDKTVFERKIAFVNDNFFDFFPHPILKGNPQTILATKNSIAISEMLEKQLFGDNESLGKTIKFGSADFIISGVYKLMKPSVIEVNAVIKKSETSNQNNWGGFMDYTFYKINKNSDIKEIEKKLHTVFIDNHYKKEAKSQGKTLKEFIDLEGTKPFLEKLTNLRMHAKGLGIFGLKGNYLLLIMMFGLSILIIILSSINFINLSIASARNRAKEVGVKKTLGVSKKSLIIHYLFEVFINGMISFVIALVIVEIILPFYNIFISKELSLFNAKVILQVFVFTSIISIIIGLITALYISNYKIIKVLKGDFNRSGNISFTRNLLLGLQFIISGFFLIGGLVVYQQVNYMNTKDLGFSGEQIMIVPFNDYHDKWQKYNLLKSEFKNDVNIESISSSNESPGEEEKISLDVSYKERLVDSEFIPIDYDHLDMLKAKFVLGRNFSRKFTSDTINSAIFNQTAIKRLGIKNPINTVVEISGKKFNIIGVVKDFHFSGFDKKIKPICYTHYFGSFNWLRNSINSVHFKIKPENSELTIQKIERFWNENIEPGYPFSYHFLDQNYAKTFDKFKKQQTLFKILTILVIIIALIGLFALATLTIQQRLKEVAIRKTLGASTKEIIMQLIKDFIKIVIIASLILLPIAYYFMQNWLDNFVYKIEMPIIPYIITPIILILLVVIVVGFKAFKATKIDLIKYLKFE